MVKTNDITGNVYGLLKVIKQANDCVRANGKKEAMWLCECSCKKHTMRIVRGTDLKNGHTHSCGCQSVVTRINHGKKNEYYILDGIVHVKLTNVNEEMLCDINFWDKYKSSCWSKDTTGYARATKGGKNIYVHRLIMPEYSTTQYVDHINGNKLDNRKQNLRYATPKQSMMNISRKDSNTGVKGVYYCKKTSKYTAYIHNNGKKHLGTFNTLDEAKEARINAEIIMYGKYSEQLSRK